jgi:hypothetical protein
MDVNTVYEDLRYVIDESLRGETVLFNELRASIAQVSSCILENYDNSRDLVQRTIGLLEKCPDKAIYTLLYEVREFVEGISSCYSYDVENSQSIYDNYIAPWSDEDIKSIYEKVLPLCNENHVITQYYEQLATALLPNERRQFVNIAISCIQQYGTQTQWDKDFVDLQYSIFSILYAICKYDAKMRLCFRVANNFIDRLPSSTNQQITRDFAECLLVIGHAEHMEIDAYLSASRAYTLCHGTLGGLFYMRIAIMAIKESNRKLATDEVFEILWLLVKILRDLPWHDAELTNLVIRRFNELPCKDYDVVCFMCSVFTLKFKHQQQHVASEILDFLNEYREAIMRHLDHSSAPWYTLLSQLNRFYPSLFNDQLEMYKTIFEANLEKNGNERLIDYLNGENLAKHLFETIRQLEKTRNLSDYATDNQSAIVIANRLLPDAVAQANVGDFVLAMRVKTDFTFIFKETYQNGMYRKLELDDATGTYDTPYRHINMLPHVVCMDSNDCALWIANVQDLYYYMTLRGNEYDIRELESFRGINVSKLRKVVSQQQFISDVVDKYRCYYKKSMQDYEAEDAVFSDQFGQYTLPIPNNTQRLLIVKDVAVAAIPHQLLTMPSGELVGACLPSANMISTEFMVQSNFYNNISSGAHAKLWIPLDSGDYTLNQMWSHLEARISNYGINIFTTKSIETQLNGEINIVCAHGAKSMDQTEWFYAHDEPIKDVDEIVGNGKLLILLVCYAGTMSSGFYDTAVHSIVKRFIRDGYCSVIAPVWSLSTEIVPLWMEVFMNELYNNKAYVIDAVYRANMAVKEDFTAISAWACMHLYGNPYLQINEMPSLSLREKTIQNIREG